MDWFHNITLKNKFIGLLVIILVLSLTIGFLLTKNIRTSSTMVGEISANDTRALYAKELQILLLRIEGGFKNLADLEEGIDDADINIEIVRQTIGFLKKAQDGTGSTAEGSKPVEKNHPGMSPTSSKSNPANQAINLGAYADSYENFYKNARAAAEKYLQSPDGDAEDYFAKIDGLKEVISQRTDELMTQYVTTAARHAGHVKTMLSFTGKVSIGLLAILTGVIFFVTLLIMYGTNRALRNIRTVTNDIIDQGWNLTLKLEQRGNDEFSQIASMFNQFIERLRTTLLQVRRSTGEIALVADSISVGNDRLAERNAEQASSLEETASSMEEMTSVVQSNASNAGEVSDLAENMRESAQQGGDIVSEAIVAMAEIRESSEKMSEIISVVDGISFQTNLLALNAAVEAARAGEQGRGFSVVAGEVRALAQRSAEAAREVKQLIGESSNRVKAGSEYVNRSGEVLVEIIDNASNVHQIVSHVAAASEEQAQGIEQVNNSVAQMDSMNQQNTELVEEIAIASQKMNEQTDRLREMISAFTLGDDAEAHVSIQAADAVESRAANRDRLPGLVDEKRSVVTDRRHNMSGTDLSPDWETF
ncbi:MAG: methyl-accepting chemotaxis protein [Acidiferrobacterales bacterium]|nr:methyl-accepting chemotaxis protein [Acidiferrobacterales bacterium]